MRFSTWKESILLKSCYLLTLILCVHSAESTDANVTSDNEYKYLEFILEWKPGRCYNSSDCRTGVIPESWKIHGLWPSMNYTTYPTNCEGECSAKEASDNFIGDFVTDIVGRLASKAVGKSLGKKVGDKIGEMVGEKVMELAESWPEIYSFLDDEDDESAWEYEWCMYGTCSKDILRTPSEYFEQALILYDSASLDDALESAEITPNRTTSYSFSTLNRELSRSLGVSTIRYWCKEKQGEDNKQVLYRVGMCVEKSLDFEWQDCPGGEFEEKCDEAKEFYLMPGSAATGMSLSMGLLFIVFLVSLGCMEFHNFVV